MSHHTPLHSFCLIQTFFYVLFFYRYYVKVRGKKTEKISPSFSSPRFFFSFSFCYVTHYTIQSSQRIRVRRVSLILIGLIERNETSADEKKYSQRSSGFFSRNLFNSHLEFTICAILDLRKFCLEFERKFAFLRFIFSISTQ